MKKYTLILISILLVGLLHAQEQPIVLTLTKTIEMAKDSSLEAFRTQNMYLANYWQYRTYKANRLPSLSMNLMPAQYYRDITKRYDSENNVDIYREQQTYTASGGLAVKQNFDLTGGAFFLESNLSYMRNFGTNTFDQFTSVPIRLGYRQDLVGYNPFKWERAIEPVRFEEAKRKLLYNTEAIAEQSTEQFFALALAQTEYDMAVDNLASSDSLFKIGEQRYAIASITQAELLTLKLDVVNARNTLQNAVSGLKRAMFSLASYLNLEKNTQLRVTLPVRTRPIDISIDRALELVKDNNPQMKELERQLLEARQQVDKTYKEALFNASINASIGFNQVAYDFLGAYRNPMQQDLVALSVSMPLIDWGVRKGKHNMAKNNLMVSQISAQQSEVNLEKDVIVTVEDFHVQQSQIATAEEAFDLASLAYNETKLRFMIGKADVNSLTLALNRQQTAQRNYVSALQKYWMSYYKLRKLTLYDFELNFPLSTTFESIINNRKN